MIYLMQGVPGSGKSTWARTNLKNPVVCSADDYFLDRHGVYHFDPTKLGKAHASCMRKFIEALINKKREIVVDNTNTTVMEMAPYYLAAQAYDRSVTIVHFDIDPRIAAARNTHGVPAAAVERMAAAQQPPPPFWDVKTINVKATTRNRRSSRRSSR